MKNPETEQGARETIRPLRAPLLFQNTGTQFPVPKLGDSQPPTTTPAPGDLMLLLTLSRTAHTRIKKKKKSKSMTEQNLSILLIIKETKTIEWKGDFLFF